VWPPVEERAEALVAEAVGPDPAPVGSPPTIAEGAVVLPEGRALGYVEYGDPDGDVVLWFHGTPGARRQVPPDIAVAASERGFRVIGIERPGTGLSTPYLYGRVLDWAADVRAVVDQLGIDRFAAVGLSGGGPYVLAVAHELADRVTATAVLGGIGPTRGPESCPGIPRLLVPIEPLLALGRYPLGEVATLVFRPMDRIGSQAFDLYARVAPASDRAAMKIPELKDMFLHDLAIASRGGVRSSIYDLVLFGREWGFSLRDIDVPVRFWHGDADGIVPFGHGELQASLVPGADLVICPGGGHFVGFLLTPDVFTWIDEQWPDRVHAGLGAGDVAG
jgi:pimeloyl-ACP methyl ester carboxylesterase